MPTPPVGPQEREFEWSQTGPQQSQGNRSFTPLVIRGFMRLVEKYATRNSTRSRGGPDFFSGPGIRSTVGLSGLVASGQERDAILDFCRDRAQS